MLDKKYIIGEEGNQKEIKNAERYICVILLVIICLLMYNNSKLDKQVKQYKINNINTNLNER